MKSSDRSIALLAERIAGVGAALAAQAQRWRPFRAADAAERPVIATGIGGSEGPARTLITRLTATGTRRARFLPLSAFLGAAPPCPHASLVVFSQGLSHNARIALRHHQRYRHTFVASAIDPAGGGATADYLRQLLAHGVTLVRHGPASESELLVRIIGPAVASMAALYIADQLNGVPLATTQQQCQAMLQARRQVVDGELLLSATAERGRLALVGIGDSMPLLHGLRWKLLEALGDDDPAVWDALQVAHGPLQAIYRRRATLLAFSDGCPEHAGAFQRLRQVLVPERHALHVVSSRTPAPWCWFEHDAWLNGIVLRTLRHDPRDLTSWPGKGRDAPLYDFEG